jgi:hypothetical protein
MPTFKDKKLEVVRGVVEPVLLDTVQRMVRQTLWEYAQYPPHFFRSDGQVALRNYLGRLNITEALMYALTPRVAEIVGANLVPTYSYPVINFPGAELKRHTDRPACEVTATLTILNEPDEIWPIFVEEGGTAHQIDLSPGDLALYDGISYPHWRAPQAEGHYNVSAFFHYVEVGGPFEEWHRNELKAHPQLMALYEPLPLSTLFPKRER